MENKSLSKGSEQERNENLKEIGPHGWDRLAFMKMNICRAAAITREHLLLLGSRLSACLVTSRRAIWATDVSMRRTLLRVLARVDKGHNTTRYKAITFSHHLYVSHVVALTSSCLACVPVLSMDAHRKSRTLKRGTRYTLNSSSMC